MKTVIKIKRKPRLELLGAGTHTVRIVSSSEDESNVNPDGKWDDVTPQAKHYMKNEEGYITLKQNMRAFKNEDDFEGGVAPEGYRFEQYDEDSTKFLVNNETNERVEDEARTAELHESFGDFASCAGIEGDEAEYLDILDALPGQVIVIKTKANKNGFMEVVSWSPVEAEVEVEA